MVASCRRQHKNALMSSCKVPEILRDFNVIRVFSSYFNQKSSISNLGEIPSLGTALIHADKWADGRTELTKLLVAFCDYTNVPET